MGLKEMMAQNDKFSDESFRTIQTLANTGGDGDRITYIPLSALHPFRGHTFRVLRETPDYQSLMQSIQAHGIQQPLKVRPSETTAGEYEILVGHRRADISMQLGLDALPCIITPCDYDTAIQIMAESNIQRPDWLPSEKAKTYKAHMEATQRKSGITERMRTDLPTVATRLTQSDNCTSSGRNRDIAAEVWGISGQTFDTYMKLNDLLPELLDKTDEGFVALKAAYQLSFLNTQHQQLVLDVLTEYPTKKVAGQKAKEIRDGVEDDELDKDYILRVLGIKRSKREPEKQISIRFTSSSLLKSNTIRQALDDPDILNQIEELLINYANENHLPLK